MEDDSSSAADETVCTLAEACSAAAATVVAWRLVSSEIADIEVAVDCISVAAEATALTTPLTEDSKLSASVFMAFFFSISACFFCSSASSARRSTLMALSLNTCTALAISPISSLFSVAGIATDLSPPAKRAMASVIAFTGPVMPEAISQTA
ncbi:MAG: hypothetical protein FD149_1804 [Rhodospirillaceae bacterium]|nr:MAG: hypothetical protein FD149_1804 [Rhodospirillaceae bacterium]